MDENHALGDLNVKMLVARSIRQINDGGYIMSGLSDSMYSVNGYKYGVVRLDSNGNLVWFKELETASTDDARDAIQTSDGGFIVAGHGSSDFWIAEIDSNGNVTWQKTLGGSGSDVAYSVLENLDGDYVAAGVTRSSDGDVSNYRGGADAWVVKLNTSGNLIWEKTFGGFSDEQANSIVQKANGNYVIVGHTNSIELDVDKISSASQDLWFLEFSEPSSSSTTQSTGINSNLPMSHNWTDPNYSIEMVRISSGTFMMGAKSDELDLVTATNYLSIH